MIGLSGYRSLHHVVLVVEEVQICGLDDWYSIAFIPSGKKLQTVSCDLEI